MSADDLTAILEPESDGRFSVHIPTLPGVHSSGTTREEALQRVAEAAKLWIEVESEQGRSIPGNDPLPVISEISRIIADQRADDLDPQLELVSVEIAQADRKAAWVPYSPTFTPPGRAARG